MTKGVIGLLILAGFIVFWFARGALRIGREVYDATVDGKPVVSKPVGPMPATTGDYYLDQFIHASAKLGVTPNYLLAHPRAKEAKRDGVTPQEYAFMNAVGVYVKDWIAHPALGPQDLDRVTRTGYQWVEEGTIRKDIFSAALYEADDKLQMHGLTLRAAQPV